MVKRIGHANLTLRVVFLPHEDCAVAYASSAARLFDECLVT